MDEAISPALWVARRQVDAAWTQAASVVALAVRAPGLERLRDPGLSGPVLCTIAHAELAALAGARAPVRARREHVAAARGPLFIGPA